MRDRYHDHLKGLLTMTINCLKNGIDNDNGDNGIMMIMRFLNDYGNDDNGQ